MHVPSRQVTSSRHSIEAKPSHNKRIREANVLRVIPRIALSAAVCALLLCCTALAEDYPNKPIRVVIPFPPGGPTDGMARIVSDRLAKLLGQAVVVDNRGGGAGGSVGAKSVAASEPDGYSILMTPGGSLTTGPAVHANIGYDPLTAFTPVAQLITTHQFLCVQPSLPVKTLPELI